MKLNGKQGTCEYLVLVHIGEVALVLIGEVALVLILSKTSKLVYGYIWHRYPGSEEKCNYQGVGEGCDYIIILFWVEFHNS